MGALSQPTGQGLGLLAARNQNLDNLHQVDICQHPASLVFERPGAVFDVIADQQNAPSAVAQGIGRKKEREACGLARSQRELRRRNMGFFALGMRLDLQHGIADVGGHEGPFRLLPQGHVAKIDDARRIYLDFRGHAVALEQDIERHHFMCAQAVQAQGPRNRSANRWAEGHVQRQGALAVGRQQELAVGVD